MKLYNYKKFDAYWQKKWEEDNLYETPKLPGEKKVYVLDMFPYPSGEGLHVGHPKGYIATDIYSRFKRMSGYDVLHPMGWDAFGLPAEQFALKHKVQPRVAVEKNIANFKQQLSHLGLDYDWKREINTTDPEFYKWTQWIFTKLYEKGLAYESNEPINWCPTCKTGLANEDLNGNLCERCDSVVEKKPLRQWVLKITDYADRMIKDLDNLAWPEGIKTAQKNWIGRSEGAEFDFKLDDGVHSIKVFTTRADTLFGATFVAISAELASGWFGQGIIGGDEVKKYIVDTLEDAKKENDYSVVQEKTGTFSGMYAINPATKEKIPVWIANYVVGGVGTGALMAVPAHDERDYEFAKKYDLPIKEVVSKHFVMTGNNQEQVDKETLVRRVVDPIIRDEEGNFYCIKEPNGDVHFAGGGVDEDETEEEALGREVKEEIGFTDFTITRKVVQSISVWGYRHTKQKNQRSIGPAYEVILRSKNRVHSEVEDGKHELVILKKEDVLKTLSWPHHQYLFEQYVKNSFVYTEDGVLVNGTDDFNSLTSTEARVKIMEAFGGKKVVRYKLQDWVFARQRYWGEPFPVVRDENGKVYMVDESELPVLLPEVEQYEPTGTGESPLAAISDWVNVNGYITQNGTFKSVPDFSAFDFNKEEPLDVNIGPGNDAYVSSAPITERNNVACIIKHPTEEKYLVSKWKQVAWNGFLTGGIEEGVTMEETAKQEVREETGYTNIKNITPCNFASHSLFYHIVKKQNRLAHYNLVVVELEDLTKVDVSDEEQAICDFVWVSKNEVMDMLTRYDMKSLWQKYIEGVVSMRASFVISKFTRETNTMPQWAGSSWYYLRFLDPHNKSALINPEIEKAWGEVSVYVGGDHATRHLIYARFWHKFLYDIGVVSTNEPFARLEFLGFILAEDGRKMSKRWGNIINPDDVVNEYGADTLRVYEMFMAPFDQTAAWSTSSIKGSDKFLDRVYALRQKIGSDSTVEVELNKTIKKVGEDIENFKFNTAVSSMMILVNTMESSAFSREDYMQLLRILAPFGPHITEQIWYELGNKTFIHKEVWPRYDASKLIENTVTLAIQIGGKMRGTVEIARDSDDSLILDLVKNHEMYKKYVGDIEPKKVIIVKNKIVNIVI